MAVWKTVKKNIKPTIDTSGYRQVKQIGQSLLKLLKHYLSLPQVTRRESFSEAIEQLQLTEVDLLERKKHFSRLTILWLLMFILTLGYTIYTVRQQAWLSILPALSISLIMLMQAFRYHFWLFQLRQRKLGCSVYEWWTATFKKRGTLS
jgi:intracellular multiplication protein IcmV